MNVSNFTVIIPARYASTRLPAKPLADIAGKPMIAHVLEQAKASGAQRVIVATDHQDVYKTVEQYGGQACMTNENHQSGTERLAEVIDLMQIKNDEIIINVQGDEPLVPPAVIAQLANNMGKFPVQMATLATPILHANELFNPNAVKVVRDKFNHALYFSRATIPWDRESFKHFSNDPASEGAATSSSATRDDQINQFLAQQNEDVKILRHLGIYGYRAGFIKQYIELAPSPLEQIELLEQLRVLWHGEKIHVDIAIETPEAGVDTQEDLERVRAILSEKA